MVGISGPFIKTIPRDTGIGLSNSCAIDESHAGSVLFFRSCLSGAIFVLDLPTANAEARSDA
jgi:nitrogen-specific signal transduction histidine kinase